MAMAIAESAASAQRLRREAEKGIRFRRSAGRLVQARRVAKGMNIGKIKKSKISQQIILKIATRNNGNVHLVILIFRH